MKQLSFNEIQNQIQNAPANQLAAIVSVAYCTLRDRREETGNMNGSNGKESLRAYMNLIQEEGINT